MSLLPRTALSALLLTLACSSSKPPEGKAPESSSTPESSEPAVATPSADAPAAPGSPAAADPAAPEAPSTAPVVETLFVRDRRATCEGEGVRQCLQVRNAETDAWRNLFATIEGFDYEAGYLYQLEVETEHVVNPPQDAASLKYRLLKVVSKQKPTP